jgi:hypothetical protein
LGHECQTVREAGFVGKKNGELLMLGEGRWDVLLTTDRKIEYQQDMIGRKIGILVLRAKTNRLQDLLPILPISRASASLNPTGSGSRSRDVVAGFWANIPVRVCRVENLFYEMV